MKQLTFFLVFVFCSTLGSFLLVPRLLLRLPSMSERVSYPQHEVPFHPELCSWLSAYQRVHGVMVEGRRELRVAILQLPYHGGLGDLFRGLLSTMINGALTGRMILCDWPEKLGGEVLDVLQQAFLPQTIMWNRTEVRTMKHVPVADIPSEVSFLRHLVPVGISPIVVKADLPDVTNGVSKVDERYRSRITDLSGIGTIEYNDGKVPVSELRANEFLANLSSFSRDVIRIKSRARPFPRHVEQILEQSAKEWSEKFSADQDARIIRELPRRQGDMQRSQCATRLLFNSLAPPLREQLSHRLVAVAESYRSLALKLDAWPKPPAARRHQYIRTGSEDRHSKCDGLTLTQCLASQLEVKTRPLIGIHYRVGDRAFSNEKGQFYGADRRNERWQVRDAVACGRTLAESLGFDSPVFLLMTDDEAMKNAIRTAHSKNQTAIFYNTKTDQTMLADELSENLEDVKGVNITDILVPDSPPALHLALLRASLLHKLKTDKFSVLVNLFAELLALATSDALVLTRSGFGRIACMFGGYPANRVAGFNLESSPGCNLNVT